MLDGDYSSEELTVDMPYRLLARLGRELPRSQEFAEELFNDLDERRGGFGWWADSVPSQQRILISDYMAQVADDIPNAILHAAVAAEDLESWGDAATSQWRQRLESGKGFNVPPPERPADDLQGIRQQLATIGVLSSLSKVFDHVAALVIGVYDEPHDLRRADWSTLRRGAGDRPDLRWLWDAAEGAGPPGWLSWFLDWRNALTHRPDQLAIMQGRIYGMGLTLPRPTDPGRFRLLHHLSASPGLSFVESQLTGPTFVSEYLTENSAVSMRMLLNSVSDLVEVVAGRLDQHWRQRRLDGDPQRHQRQQRKRTSRKRFLGFAPGSEPFTVDQMHVAPRTLRRTQAAQLMDDVRREVWFDGGSGP